MPVCRCILSLVFIAKDAMFDFPIYLSLSEKLGMLKFIIQYRTRHDVHLIILKPLSQKVKY